MNYTGSLSPLLVLVCASSTAMAELTPVADKELSRVTGGSGITMELSSLVSVSSLEFEDSGRFRMDDIVVGGAGVTTSGASEGFGQYFDQLAISLDVLDTGVLEIGMRALPSAVTGGNDTIDWGISTGAIEMVSATGNSARLASGLEAWGRILSSDYRVAPNLNATGYNSRQSLLIYTVDDLDLFSGTEGVSITDMQVSGTESGGLQMGTDALNTFFTEATDLSADEVNRSVLGAESGFAVMNSSVGTEPVVVDGVSRELTTIRVDAMAADITVGNMAVGGVDLGSAHLDNLRVSDTAIRFNNY
ncbi:MAG: DUF6160 family protein [Pseudomonadota bacterium]